MVCRISLFQYTHLILQCTHCTCLCIIIIIIIIIITQKDIFSTM